MIVIIPGAFGIVEIGIVLVPVRNFFVEIFDFLHLMVSFDATPFLGLTKTSVGIPLGPDGPDGIVVFPNIVVEALGLIIA
jgi:hypothetical protein